MDGAATVPDMRPKERSAFGERLWKARTHAKLSQTQLATATRMSQSNMNDLEWFAEGSAAVVRLAMACKVRPEWLAENSGPMVEEGTTWPFTTVSRDTILELDEAQRAMVEGAMLNVLGQLRGVVQHPNQEDIERWAVGHPAEVKPKQKKKKS